MEDVIQGVTDLEDAHAAMTESSKTLKEHLDTMADLQRRLEAADEDERLELRRRLQQTITKAIRRLTIYPDGLRANIVSLAIDNDGSRITIKPFLDEDDAFQEERIKHLTDHIQANTGRENACFLVEFANGHTRLFRRDPSEKKARFLVDSEMTSDSLVIGGRDFVANHGPKITISKEPFGGKPPADQEQPEQTGDSKPPAVSWTPRRRQKISGYISHLVDTALPIPEEGEGKPADE
ncbi:MAG: hypothetical protein IH612_02130 [Desulfofustis sp.]|nr:hypothetical protein [Desulfofustis sp.]